MLFDPTRVVVGIPIGVMVNVPVAENENEQNILRKEQICNQF